MAEWLIPVVSRIAKTWREVKHVRAPFFGLLAIGCAAFLALGVAGGAMFFSERMAVQEERLKQKDDLLAEFWQKAGETPDIVAAKLRDSETEIAELKDRKLRPVEQKFEENSDGTYTISSVMQVVSLSPPAGLCVRAEADGFIEMTVEEVDPQPSVLRSIVQETPDTWYIHSPSGTFLITVRAKSPNGTLYYQFDKRDC